MTIHLIFARKISISKEQREMIRPQCREREGGGKGEIIYLVDASAHAIYQMKSVTKSGCLLIIATDVRHEDERGGISNTTKSNC